MFTVYVHVKKTHTHTYSLVKNMCGYLIKTSKYKKSTCAARTIHIYIYIYIYMYVYVTCNTHGTLRLDRPLQAFCF